MAAKQIALVLQKNFGRIGTVLIYAVLEWVLIFLLIINALLSYLSNKFADFFGLHPPCLWCNRVDHVLGKQGPGFYRKLVCDLHAKEISSLGYCYVHKHLADVQGMCEDCLLSFAEEDKPNSCTYVGKLGLDLEVVARVGKKNMKSHGLTQNEEGFHLENHKGENGEGYHWNHERDKRGHGIEGNEEIKHEIHVNSQTGARQVGKSVTNEWIQSGICSCCKAPLKRSSLLLQRLMGKPVINQNKVNMPAVSTVVDFAEGVDKDKILSRSVEYHESILQECTYKAEDEAVVEAQAQANNASWTPLGHIGYTVLKDTSDSGSETSDDKEEFAGKGLQVLASQVEVITSESPMQGLDHDRISDVKNSCVGPVVIESKVENHKSKFSEQFSQRPVDGGIDPQTIETHQNDFMEQFSQRPVDSGIEPQLVLVREGSFTMKPKIETRFKATYSCPANTPTCFFGSSVLSPAELVTDAISQLPHKSVEVVPSLEETLIALEEPVNKKVSLEVSAYGVVLGHGLGELEWDGVSDYGQHSRVAPTKLKDIVPAATIHVESTSSKHVHEDNKVCFEAEVSQPALSDYEDHHSTVLHSESKGPPTETVDAESTCSNDVLEDNKVCFEREVSGPVLSDYGNHSTVSPTKRKDLPADILHTESAASPKDMLQDDKICFETKVSEPVLSTEVKGTSAQFESVEGAASEEIREDFGRENMIDLSEKIEVSERKVELKGLYVGPFKEEGVNKPQEEGKLSLGCFSARELFRTDPQISHSMAVGMNTGEEYRNPETPRFIEGLHMLHKRLSIDRNDSGFDSLDGSILSEIEGESAVDRLKRQLELERKSQNTLYTELEAERNASAIAANQAMAMITRLQEEKAAMQMEALQYQRMMEEQAEYDQEALQLLNEVLAKREKEIKDLEKEVELYRKRFCYEAKKKKDKRRKTSSENVGSHSEGKRNGYDHPSNKPYEKLRSSSVSSLNEDTDGSSSNIHENEEDIDLPQNNQNTPVELIMGAGGAYEDQELEDSLDESIVDLEEERLSILEHLKSLEEKLHILADEEEYDVRKPPKKASNISIIHPEENAELQEFSDAIIEENRSSWPETGEDASNGNDKFLSVGRVDPSADSKVCTPRRSGVVKGKKLLPLFEATSFEEEQSYHAEASYPVGQSNDWRTISMIVRDNSRNAIEEEVHHLNERLQALEADREFMRHSIKSLRKGDEGMKLLQEIAQHLRELRRVDLRAGNLNDTFVQQNAGFVTSPEGNGMIPLQDDYRIS